MRHGVHKAVAPLVGCSHLRFTTIGINPSNSSGIPTRSSLSLSLSPSLPLSLSLVLLKSHPRHAANATEAAAVIRSVVLAVPDSSLTAPSGSIPLFPHTFILLLVPRSA